MSSENQNGDGGTTSGIVTASEVESRLNWMEDVVTNFSATDEYDDAILDNQRLMVQLMAQQGAVNGGVVDDTRDVGGRFSDWEAGALPEDSVGVLARDANPNDTAPAVFQISGTVFYAVVRNTDTDELQAGTSIRVVGDRNRVTAEGAAGNIAGVGGVGGDNTFRYEGRLYQFPQVADPEETVAVANEKYVRGTRSTVGGDLPAGTDKTFARIEPDANEFLLLDKTNATSLSDAQYNYYLDEPNSADPDLSGTAPWASPPNLYDVNPEGYVIVEDYVELEIVNTSSSTDYSNVQGTLTGILVEV